MKIQKGDMVRVKSRDGMVTRYSCLHIGNLYEARQVYQGTYATEVHLAFLGERAYGQGYAGTANLRDLELWWKEIG